MTKFSINKFSKIKPLIQCAFVITVLLLAVPETTDDVNAQPSSGKYIIFTFDDNPIGQYNYAKPVLDTYGYKATFFVVCNWVDTGNNPSRMSWAQIKDLARDGQDIESHTMTHPNLNHKSISGLNFEIGASKKCLAQHGHNATVFAYPRNLGSDNATVVNIVSQYYQSAKTLYNHGQEPLWYLSCDGYTPNNKTNCSTLTNGKLQYANRYDIRMGSIDDMEKGNNYNDTAVYNIFVHWINSQTQYNINGSVIALPVVTLHEIVSPPTQSSWLNTNQLLLAKMIRYIHDNGFTVLKLNDLGYNNKSNVMYVKGITPSNLTGTVLSLNKIGSPHWSTSMTLSGKLTDNTGNALGGKSIEFTGSGKGSILSTITNNDGVFSFKTPAPNTVGSAWNSFQINAIYTGDKNYTADSGSQFFNTLAHFDSLSLTISPNSVHAGGNFSVSGTLIDTTTGKPIDGMNVSFTSDSPLSIPDTITDSSGNFTISGLTAPDTPGTYNIIPHIDGIPLYKSSNFQVQTLNVSILP